MMRSMFSAVSGLRVHQTKMDVIAHNISNVNTVGYKSSRVTFNEVFSQTVSGASAADETTGRGGTNPMQIGLGAGVASIDKIMTQGAAQRTDNPFDLMIQGNGFFIVGTDTNQFFTKAGAMNLDAAGNLIGAGGYNVLGWDVGDGAIQKGKVQPIRITGEKQYSTPNATTDIEFNGNLNFQKEKDPTRSISFYDSIGNRYVVDVQLKSTGDGKWNISFPQKSVGVDDGAGNITQTAGVWAYPNGDRTKPVQINATTSLTDLEFDTQGKLKVPAGQDGTAIFTIVPVAALKPPASIGDAGKIIIDFKNVTQFGNEESNVKSETTNGNEPGLLTGINIGTDGIMTGRYSNGKTRILAQIPVAIFKNPAGLEKMGENLFTTTPNSGGFDEVGETVQSSGGKIMGGVLEMSNVDLSSEFTEMITTQRGFQANSRVITTSDDMLQELVNLKR